MKRLCFGTLMHILYQARNQKVTNDLLCDAIFSSYSQTTNSFDSSLPGHLKSGRNNVPPDVIASCRYVPTYASPQWISSLKDNNVQVTNI